MSHSNTTFVFLCHSSGDKPVVRSLYQRLKADGFHAWLDEEDLIAGQDWEHEIRVAVRKSIAVVVCLSRTSINKSGFLQKEIKYALDVADEQPEGTIFVIPLRLEECEVPVRLSKWHWVNYFESPGYEKLQRALQERIGIEAMAVPCPPSEAASLTSLPVELPTVQPCAVGVLQEALPGRQSWKVGRAIPRRKSGKWPFWSVILCFCAIVGLLFWKTMSQPIRIKGKTTLVTRDYVTQAAISPDGQYVAYASEQGDREALRVFQTGTGEDKERLSARNGSFTGITFSHDGYIYYVLLQGKKGNLYRVPLLDGDSKLLIEDVDSGVAISPDGNSIAFVRGYPQDKQTSIILKGVNDEKEIKLATVGDSRWFHHTPLWWPDGSSLLCVVYNSAVSDHPFDIASVGIPDGQMRIIMHGGPWKYMGKPVWISNGHDVAAAVVEIGSKRGQLLQMRVSWPDSRIVALVQDSADYLDMDSVAGGQHFVTIESERLSRVWIVNISDPNQSRPITQPGERLDGLMWMPDRNRQHGKLIVQREIGGHQDLWLIDPKTEEMKPITEGADIEQDPVATPDGRYLIYSSPQEGVMHLFRANQDGKKPMRLTADSAVEMQGVATPDSQSVIYTSLRDGGYGLWKVPIEGGHPRLISRPARNPSVSPDGAWIACEYLDPARGWSVALVSSKSGKVSRLFPDIPIIDSRPSVRWTADSGNLVYAITEKGISNVSLQPIGGGAARRVTHFHEDHIFDFAVSPDGKFLACIRGPRTSQVVLTQLTR